MEELEHTTDQDVTERKKREGKHSDYGQNMKQTWRNKGCGDE